MNDLNVINVTENNVDEYGFFCSKNKKFEGYKLKRAWLEQRFKEGLGIRLLQSETEGTIGFIEFTPGEFNWRGINAKGYLVIHCMFITLKKYRNKGCASLLVKECLQEAKKRKMNGVAVVTSDGPWLADKRVFVNNGFEIVDKTDRFELLVKQLKKSKLPNFTDWERNRKEVKGFNIIYSNQCPYHIKSVNDLCEEAEERGLDIKVTELTTPEESQNTSSIYGTFAIVNDGKLLADHYISKTRFKNILKKEI